MCENTSKVHPVTIVYHVRSPAITGRCTFVFFLFVIDSHDPVKGRPYGAQLQR